MSFDVTPYLGRPFDAETWNCWTLVTTVFAREFGVALPDGMESMPGPADRELLHRTIAEESAKFIPVTDTPQPGDIVTMRIYRHVCHVGIMHSARRALHVMELTETYLADLTSAEWKSRVSAFYRHPELCK